MADNTPQPQNIAAPDTSSPQSGQIDAIHSEAVDKSTSRKAGSGRHPKGCQCAIHGGRKKTSAPIPQTENTTAVSDVSTIIDRAAIETAVEGVLKVVDDLVKNRVSTSALRIGNGDATLANELVEIVALRPVESKTIASLSATICERYTLLGKYAPEILLVVCIGGYVGRTGTILKRLDILEKQNANRTSKPASTPSDSA